LFAAIKSHKVDGVVAAYDVGGNWRKKENSEYKANRPKERTPLHAEIDLLVTGVLPQLGISAVAKQGFEADDVIATITRQTSPTVENVIFSCDKDMFQLVNDRTKVLLFNSAKKIEMVDSEGVERHFGVLPEEVLFYKALVGDSSDNIKGIKGIGPKTAAKMITSSRGNGLVCQEAYILHSLNEKGKDVTAFQENMRLISLQTDVPDLQWNWSSLPPEEHVRGILTALEFNSMLKEKRFAEIMKCLSQIGLGFTPSTVG
jgi:DNA polymerase-1